MPIEVHTHAGVGTARATGESLRLDAVAAELYADLRLSPLLRRLVGHSRRLLGGMAGSISLLDPGRENYAKMAEQGASCRLGQTFSLTEGVTGQVVTGQRPVVLERYSDISRGHLPATHPASSGAVAAVPIWWRGDVIGANVVFAGRDRRYTAAEVDELEVLTHVAAAGIVRFAVLDPSPPVARGSVRETSPFTAREQDVLDLLALGLSNAQLAKRLLIAPKTVEKHVGAILRKTGSKSRTAAAMAALESGWIRPLRPAYLR